MAAKKATQAKIAPAALPEEPAAVDNVVHIPEIAIFVDVESLNVVASAALPSIGCVVVDMNAKTDSVITAVTDTIADYLTECGSAGDSSSTVAAPSVWYRTLDVTSQLIQYNRTMSKSTQRWWHVAHRNAVGSVLAQPAANVADTLNYMINYLRNAVERHVSGLSIADRKKAMDGIRVYARGTHFDVGAIETLVYEVLGLLPATESTLAFQDALWFYRSARDARSYVDGLQDAYRNAMSDEGFAATEDVIKSNTKQAQKYLNSLLAERTQDPSYLSGAAHHPVYDVFYDFLQVLYWKHV